jgi:hypothetical protein
MPVTFLAELDAAVDMELSKIHAAPSRVPRSFFFFLFYEA